MITLDQFHLEQLFENAPAPPEGQNNVTMMTSACHPSAPFYGVYMQGSGRMGLRCTLCGQVWGEILIAKSLIAHAPASTLSILKKPNGGG